MCPLNRGKIKLTIKRRNQPAKVLGYEDCEPILRMLFGILCFHKAYGNYLHCEALTLKTDEVLENFENVSNSTISWTTVHRSIPETDDQKELEETMHQTFRDVFGKNDNSSISYDMLRLINNEKAEDGKNIDASILAVFQDPEPSNKVTNICKKTNIPIKHLCAVARLAEVLRPQAVHEGHELEIVFIIGTKYHRESIFKTEETIREYLEIFGPAEPKLGVAYLEWLPVLAIEAFHVLNVGAEWAKKNIKETSITTILDTEKRSDKKKAYASEFMETYLSLCSARIKSRAGDFTGSNRFLFVDYTVPFPAVSHIVSKRENGKYSMRELTESNLGVNTSDMCIVRVFGRRRIELLHCGKVELSWDDRQAKWRPPPQWNEEKLKDVILYKLSKSTYSSTDTPDKSCHNESMLIWLCEVIMQISDATGEGTSIIISQNNKAEQFAGPMREPTEKEKRDKHKDLRKLKPDEFRNLAIQDGGVIVNYSDMEVCFQQMFRPFGVTIQRNIY